ncbi:hypothetical protein HHK36_018185 [Tetracentron sinense]|uniref:Uncharacterized protein n=1 Tax=Tetracentron sinense TaxID=13715 RepID=A0A834Z3F4_TETSI|nr:hypothetical protein HHK36_018185 [Tetracentron sinense]
MPRKLVLFQRNGMQMHSCSTPLEVTEDLLVLICGEAKFSKRGATSSSVEVKDNTKEAMDGGARRPRGGRLRYLTDGLTSSPSESHFITSHDAFAQGLEKAIRYLYSAFSSDLTVLYDIAWVIASNQCSDVRMALLLSFVGLKVSYVLLHCAHGRVIFFLPESSNPT